MNNIYSSRESGYYPLGAEFDPNAPWNQSELDEKEFDVCISQTLSKSTSVNTNDYTLEGSYLDADEGGGYVEDVNTNETDWNKAYNEEHYTPLGLIEKFKEYLEYRLGELGDTSDEPILSRKKKEIMYLIKECSDWIFDDLEVVEDY